MKGRVPYGPTPMPDPPNATIASLFDELADLYELDGAVVHRVLAYRNAAKSVREAPRSVAAMTREGKVTELPGIGRTLEEKIEALLETGHDPGRREAARRIPAPASSTSRACPASGPSARASSTTSSASTRSRPARGGRGAAAARRAAASAPKFEESVLEAFAAGVGEAPRRARAAQQGAGDRRRDRRGAARASGLRSRRAGRLGAAPGRLRQGPRHHRHRLRPGGAAAPRFAELDVLEAASPRRATPRARAPTPACRSTCASSSPTSSATCCSTSRAPRQHNMALREAAVRRGLHVSEYGILDDAPARRTAARPRRRSTRCSACRGSRPSCARTAASWR